MAHQTITVVDLGYGDAGKGSVVDYLCRKHAADLVVRFNGGAQAAHAVVTPEGVAHSFHQFGSGTFSGTKTFLARNMLVNPIALAIEEEALRGLGIFAPYDDMLIDGSALVTTPYHVALNRIREYSRGDAKHGSCGAGICTTVEESLGGHGISFAELTSSALKSKLLEHRGRLRTVAVSLLQDWQWPENKDAALIDQEFQRFEDTEEFALVMEIFPQVAGRVTITDPSYLAARFAAEGATIFEGAQGVLLDEDYGFPPHTTWSKTTPANVTALLAQLPPTNHTTLGVTRAYQTRHGEGPLATENAELTALLEDKNNPTNAWQGAFRLGWLDVDALRYAILCCRKDGGLDGLVVNHLDELRKQKHWSMKVDGELRVYQNNWRIYGLELERLVDVPVVLGGYGPKAAQKKEFRGAAANK